MFFAFFSFGLAFTNYPTWGWPGGDPRDYSNLTEALVEGGNFDLRNSSRPLRRADDPTVVRRESGELYSIFPIGRPVYNVPFFAVGRAISSGESPATASLIDNLSFSVATAVLYGLSALLMFLLLINYFRESAAWSLFGTALYAICTLAFPFSKHHGVEALQIVLFMGMIYAGLRPGRWSIAFMAACFGWAVLAKPPSAVALPVAIYLFFHNRHWSYACLAAKLIAFAAAAGFAALFFYYNWMRTGDAAAAYAVGHASGIGYSLSNVTETVWPLLFGPDRNLFLNNPVLFLAVPGFFLLRDRQYIVAAAGMWVTMLLFYGSSGNQNWGAYVGNGRYAVPFIFLLIPFALASIKRVTALSQRASRLAAISGVFLLVMVSAYVQLLYASYSEFHVKQFERTHNASARQASMPELVEAKHQLRFAHTLFWYTESCQHPSAMDRFPYPSAEPARAQFSAFVLKSFPAPFFCKDYLFLNLHSLGHPLAIAMVGWLAFLLLTLASLVAVILVARQSGSSGTIRAVYSAPPAQI